MTTTPDFRELCAELVDSLENARRIIQGGDGTLHINTAEFVLRRARSALATQPPEPPTDEEIKDWAATTLGASQGNPGAFGWGWRCFSEGMFTCTIRAALKRWGK